jgi:hypothetical protein
LLGIFVFGGPLFFSIWGVMIVHEDIKKIKKFKNNNKTKL